jgi:hypothetical protein
VVTRRARNRTRLEATHTGAVFPQGCLVAFGDCENCTRGYGVVVPVTLVMLGVELVTEQDMCAECLNDFVAGAADVGHVYVDTPKGMQEVLGN